ncbi:uncharacterized protein DSM5745_00650 [Aspergillus mulundensis]|uniref:Uncharacterized protein n=1 Tax=Aspergillus mulundensis TaxID=1810919 RepID=A0A3D8T5P2_9EURO|nr:hypothetical protein DSM5745_00650 [Aspergillus mulundensis]RDW93328.1 hypothetical protein DSM5745_00650 [Aspergillus mulundensis]
MDLSSLEGPPIADTRFSNPAQSAANIPQIRFDTTFSPVSPLGPNSWDLPPRPASTSALSPRSKHSNTSSNDFWQSMHPNVTERSFRTPPNQSLNPGSSRGFSRFTTTLTPAPRSSRPHSNSVSTPHQLVWVESEQIWIVTARTTSHTPALHERPRSSSSNPGQAGETASISRSRLMNRYSSADLLTDTDTDDLPPPYEQHVYDQPIGPILPAVTRVRPEELPQRGSRWAAIGRRVT